MMEKLDTLPNIGKELLIQLRKAGIQTPQDLYEAGSCKAFQIISAYNKNACINMLFALEGAIQGIRWHSLEKSKKEELMHFYAIIQNQK